MKRAAPVLMAILLGAVATGIGMGVFLKLANDDRSRLAEQIDQAHADAEQALKDKERIANEANQKVAAANNEVTKAQKVLQALEDEQRLLADAKQLTKPASGVTRSWQPAVSLPLGVSLQIPPKTSIEENDAAGLTAVRVLPSSASSTLAADARWLSVMPYDENTAMQLNASLATSTPRSYLVNGRLLTGASGVQTGDGAISIFEVHQAGSSTHLIWIKDPGTLGTNGVERLLSTFEFAP